jgi:hypothetical protein
MKQALLACVALTLAGCAEERTIEVRAWTLQGANGSEVPLAIPIDLDPRVSACSPRCVLRARAALPEAWRGQPLTLAIPVLPAAASLSVNGVDAAQLEWSVAPGVPSRAAHAFRIDGAHTRSPEVTLELSVDRPMVPRLGLHVAPRLSATLAGDRAFLVARTINGPVTLAAYAIASMIGFTYLALYLLDRRRRVHLWFALQAMGVSAYMLEQLGLPQLLVGPRSVGSPRRPRGSPP